MQCKLARSFVSYSPRVHLQRKSEQGNFHLMPRSRRLENMNSAQTRWLRALVNDSMTCKSRNRKYFDDATERVDCLRNSQASMFSSVALIKFMLWESKATTMLTQNANAKCPRGSDYRRQWFFILTDCIDTIHLSKSLMSSSTFYTQSWSFCSNLMAILGRSRLYDMSACWTRSNISLYCMSDVSFNASSSRNAPPTPKPTKNEFLEAT